jgi:hypothetical protein
MLVALVGGGEIYEEKAVHALQDEVVYLGNDQGHTRRHYALHISSTTPKVCDEMCKTRGGSAQGGGGGRGAEMLEICSPRIETCLVSHIETHPA